MRKAGPGRGDAEVGGAAGDRFGDLVAGALVEVDVDAGMRHEEGRQGVAQNSAVAAVSAASRTRARRPSA